MEVLKGFFFFLNFYKYIFIVCYYTDICACWEKCVLNLVCIILFLYETILIKKQNCVQIRIRKIPIEFLEKFQSNNFGPKNAGIGKKKST